MSVEDSSERVFSKSLTIEMSFLLVLFCFCVPSYWTQNFRLGLNKISDRSIGSKSNYIFNINYGCRNNIIFISVAEYYNP